MDPDDVRGQLIRFIREGHSFSGHERHCCYLNTGETRFANISAASGVDFDDDGRAVGCVDWDHDGDIDFWISNRNAPQVRFLRNEIGNTHPFVAFQLRGTRCNRDAIGARVVLILDGDTKLMKTLRAGDGYLAQSSKWLHFGLGSSSKIRRVEIQWPDGHWERFEGVEPGDRFLLVEGTGRAQRWGGRQRQVRLEPAPPKLPPPTHAVELFSATRPSLPPLRYKTVGGDDENVFDKASGPVLLNLWASWCQPCLVELRELSKREAELRRAGIEVVALTVDQLNGNSNHGAEGPAQILRQLGFAFSGGVATERLVDILQMVDRHLFSLHRPLPIPTSFLIDKQGRLAAVYKGPLQVDRLLEDAARLHVEGEAKRAASVPFDGVWSDTPKQLPPVSLVIEMINQGYLEEASAILLQEQKLVQPKGNLVNLLLRLGSEFQKQGDRRAAEEHFDWAERIDPHRVSAEVQHGLAYEKLGHAAEAIGKYRDALSRNPSNLSALNNLAWLLATSRESRLRDGKAAVAFAERAALDTGRANPAVLDTLSAAYAEAGMFERAIATAGEAIRLARSRQMDELARRIETRKALYEKGQPFQSR